LQRKLLRQRDVLFNRNLLRAPLQIKAPREMVLV